MQAQFVLYQPDIPQNLGAMMRLCACMDIALHVVEPCGFPLDDKRIRRAGMDYMELVTWQRHRSWDAFEAYRKEKKGQLIIMTTQSDIPYTSHPMGKNDFFVFGRESAGLPQEIHATADTRLTIPMHGPARSLNLALSAAMLAGEINRQANVIPAQAGI